MVKDKTSTLLGQENLNAGVVHSIWILQPGKILTDHLGLIG
jgi:hypothetical protein